VNSEQLLLAGTLQCGNDACVQDFYEEVVPAYSDDAFYCHFRMTRATMQVCLCG